MIEIEAYLARGRFALDAKLVLDAPVTGLFGPSGSGKSTLLGILAGLIKPDRGRLLIDGRCLFDSDRNINVPIHQRRIGLVFQDSQLFPHLAVRSNLLYGLNRLAVKERRFNFEHVVELLEIGHLLEQHPRQLSGGEKQRVALGRAILSSPRVLLLDEPLASLDTRLKNQILPFLRRIKDEIRIPMVYVSHAINEILYLTTQVVMISDGEILGSGSFHEVISDERMLAMAHTLGLENVAHCKVVEHNPDNGYTTAILGTQHLYIPLIPAPRGGLVSVSIAASNIALSSQRLSGVTIQNQLSGRVIEIHHAADRVLVSIDAGSILVAEITSKALRDMRIEKGITIYCLIKTQSIFPLVQMP